MNRFVLDCSFAVAWLFEDKATAQTDDLLTQLRDGCAFVSRDGCAFVSNLWQLELGNVLVQAERRERITAAQISACLELVTRLPIVTDTETDSRAFREILILARTEALTIYDAAYLELAIRRGVPLATQDNRLVRAADRVEVQTLPI